MPQYAKFSDGSFVIHNLRVPTSKRTWSIWCMADGSIYDKQGQDSAWRYTDKAHANTIADLQLVASRYAWGISKGIA